LGKGERFMNLGDQLMFLFRQNLSLRALLIEKGIITNEEYLMCFDESEKFIEEQKDIIGKKKAVQ
jgi:hypothetical protein